MITNRITSNNPGGRDSMGFGIDSFGSIWMFGGQGSNSVGNQGEWKLRIINWTTYFERFIQWSLEIF